MNPQDTEISVKDYAKKSGYKYSSVTSRLNKDKLAPRPTRIVESDNLIYRRFYSVNELNQYFKNRPIKEWSQQ